MTKCFIWCGVALFAMTWACDGETQTQGAQPDVAVSIEDQGAPGDQGVLEDALAACGIEPTMASLEQHYFARSCTFSSCHGVMDESGEAKPAASAPWLVSGQAHQALVGVIASDPTAAAAGKMLVVPGDPDASYLVQKLEGPAPGEGALMPLGQTEPLDPDCAIAALRAWIEAGALP